MINNFNDIKDYITNISLDFLGLKLEFDDILIIVIIIFLITEKNDDYILYILLALLIFSSQ